MKRKGIFCHNRVVWHILDNGTVTENKTGDENMICISAKKSMTHAIKARRVLTAAGIPCDIVNLDGSLTERGCAYGVSFSCDMTEKVRKILGRHELDYGEIIGK